MTFLTPDELDVERWAWRRWRPQKGGWDQPMWIELQETWRLTIRRGQ